MNNNPKVKGELTEQKIITRLMELGKVVSVPVGDNQPYDLLVDGTHKFFRVQCKTGRLDGNGCVAFNTCSSRVNTKGSYKKYYDGLIDVFIVYCYENDEYYTIDINEAPKGTMVLRIDFPLNNQSSKVKWAKDNLLVDWVVKI